MDTPISRAEHEEFRNQYFKSINEIVEHYSKCNISPQNGEIILDSILSVDELIEKIMEEIQ